MPDSAFPHIVLTTTLMWEWPSFDHSDEYRALWKDLATKYDPRSLGDLLKQSCPTSLDEPRLKTSLT